jgi:V/A-type H+-transporting ATPase subunit C
LIRRVIKYSFAQAKTRAMKGKLLNADDWYYLLRMQRLEDIFRYLRGTDYGEALAAFSEVPPDARGVSLVLYGLLFKDYAKLLKAVPADGSQLLRNLLRRYEAENLKTILRGIWQGRPPGEIRLLLYNLGRLSILPIDKLLLLRDITDAVGLLRPGIFYAPLLHAMPQFKAQGSIFPLEIALDTAVFESIPASVNILKGTDRRGVEALAGKMIDWVNLCWLVRFRHFYGLSPEETINYILPGGRNLNLRNLGSLARTTDLSTFLAALPVPYRQSLSAAEKWTDIRYIFEKWFIHQLYTVFYEDPFQIRLQVSYLFLREIEVMSLGSLISAAGVGESPERLLDLIGLPVKGSVSV